MGRCLCATVFTLLLLPASAGATPIVINPGAGLAGNTAALAAFNRAADTWGAVFSDPITVNIAADLVAFPNPSAMAQTSSVVWQADYGVIRNQLVADAADERDDAIVVALPTTGFAGSEPIDGMKRLPLPR